MAPLVPELVFCASAAEVQARLARAVHELLADLESVRVVGEPGAGEDIPA